MGWGMRRGGGVTLQVEEIFGVHAMGGCLAMGGNFGSCVRITEKDRKFKSSGIIPDTFAMHLNNGFQ